MSKSCSTIGHLPIFRPSRRAFLSGSGALAISGGQAAGQLPSTPVDCETGRHIWFCSNRPINHSSTDPRQLHGDGLEMDREHFGTGVYEVCGNDHPILRNSNNQSFAIHSARLRAALETDGRMGLWLPGFKTSFGDALDEGVIVQMRAGLPRATSVFCWASGAYLLDHNLERIHGQALERCLVEYLNNIAGVKWLDIGAYSRGCGVLLEALDALGRSTRQRRLSKIRRIVMLAPDVHPAVFDLLLSRVAADVDFTTTVYVTKWDVALLWKSLFRGGPTVGRNVLPNSVLDRVEVVDVSAVLGLGVNHGYVFTNPFVQADMRWALGDRLEPSRHRIRLHGIEGAARFKLSRTPTLK